ncbi:hypothetical protein PAMP_003277 [Pampus punctatissimus]
METSLASLATHACLYGTKYSEDSVDSLKLVLKNKLQLDSSFDLQYEDEDFKDFCNLTCVDDLPKEKAGAWPFKLHYFDRLLQENMTGMAVCKNSGMSPEVASPVVSCKTSITVKLPGGAKLRKVKELGFWL